MDIVKRSTRLFLVVGVALLLTACARPYRVADFDARPPGQAHFPGLHTLVANAPDRVLDVLLVHGMCSHDVGWAVNAIDALRAGLGAHYPPGAEGPARRSGDVIVYQRTLIAPGGTVRANALVWTPVIAGLKRQLCYDQSVKSELCGTDPCDSPAYPHSRAKLNARLKDVILNDCLADAIIYQGASRDAILKQLRQAMLDALARSGGRPLAADILQTVTGERAPLVVITESLGSKVAFDALYQLLRDADLKARAAAERTLERMVQIFMGANQMPILALADQTLDGQARSTGYPAEPLAELVALRRDGPGAAYHPPLRVVAFTDPNDVLSYALARGKPRQSYDVVDVLVSNADTYLGQLEEPFSAHMNYRTNPEVMRLMVCGNPSPQACVAAQ
ncbi:MAG TPA: hypothetical protein PLW81_02875 [Thiobacillaceae bacterium]|nr:hypothetical protein [Thiobacillaceae bacterium]